VILDRLFEEIRDLLQKYNFPQEKETNGIGN